MKERYFLFLQGPMGPFFSKLGQELESLGAKVLRINFNTGDRKFWQGDAVNFTGRLEEFPEYFRKLAAENRFTDLVVYGDSRPVHKMAIEELKNTGAKVHVFEEGYFRPHWITLEEGGVNNNSSIPRNREFYQSWQKRKLKSPEILGSSFSAMAKYTWQYYLGMLKGMYGEFKNYHHHFDVSPHLTIALWIPKGLLSYPKKLIASYQQKKLMRLSYFLVPLQLCRDYQIREHSQFGNVPNFIEHVIENFTNHAQNYDHLVFKAHPLDNNPWNVRRAVKRSAKKHGVSWCVHYIDGGHLPSLIKNSKGMVVANSTSGLSSIHHNRPVIALSSAIYNFDGLTFQKPLAKFWQKRKKPDQNIFDKFSNYVISTTQINGNFYTENGMHKAIVASVERLKNS